MEHFGLGRYGDPIDPQAWENALKSFQRILAPKGNLYISVPVGKVDKVCFNAHRVFTPQTIIETLDLMEIVEFSYISGFDTTICMERKDDKLQIYKQNLALIPDIRNSGTRDFLHLERFRIFGVLRAYLLWNCRHLRIFILMFCTAIHIAFASLRESLL